MEAVKSRYENDFHDFSVGLGEMQMAGIRLAQITRTSSNPPPAGDVERSTVISPFDVEGSVSPQGRGRSTIRASSAAERSMVLMGTNPDDSPRYSTGETRGSARVSGEHDYRSQHSPVFLRDDSDEPYDREGRMGASASAQRRSMDTTATYVSNDGRWEGLTAALQQAQAAIANNEANSNMLSREVRDTAQYLLDSLGKLKQDVDASQWYLTAQGETVADTERRIKEWVGQKDYRTSAAFREAIEELASKLEKRLGESEEDQSLSIGRVRTAVGEVQGALLNSQQETARAMEEISDISSSVAVQGQLIGALRSEVGSLRQSQAVTADQTQRLTGVERNLTKIGDALRSLQEAAERKEVEGQRRAIALTEEHLRQLANVNADLVRIKADQARAIQEVERQARAGSRFTQEEIDRRVEERVEERLAVERQLLMEKMEEMMARRLGQTPTKNQQAVPSQPVTQPTGNQRPAAYRMSAAQMPRAPQPPSFPPNTTRRGYVQPHSPPYQYESFGRTTPRVDIDDFDGGYSSYEDGGEEEEYDEEYEQEEEDPNRSRPQSTRAQLEQAQRDFLNGKVPNPNARVVVHRGVPGGRFQGTSEVQIDPLKKQAFDVFLPETWLEFQNSGDRRTQVNRVMEKLRSVFPRSQKSEEAKMYDEYMAKVRDGFTMYLDIAYDRQEAGQPVPRDFYLPNHISVLHALKVLDNAKAVREYCRLDGNHETITGRQAPALAHLLNVAETEGTRKGLVHLVTQGLFVRSGFREGKDEVAATSSRGGRGRRRGGRATGTGQEAKPAPAMAQAPSSSPASGNGRGRGGQ